MKDAKYYAEISINGGTTHYRNRVYGTNKKRLFKWAKDVIKESHFRQPYNSSWCGISDAKTHKCLMTATVYGEKAKISVDK